MLGLILGRKAGLTMLDDPLMLLRFFDPRFALPGVAIEGDTMAAMAGLEVAEPDLPVEAVLNGPSFGVLREAMIRGVDVEESSAVFVADGGRTKSSRLAGSTLDRGWVSPDPASGV